MNGMLLRTYIVFGALLISIVGASATVDDGIVRKWIGRGFLTLDCSSPAANQVDLSVTYQPIDLYNAWKFLKKCRDSGNSSDLNLASAEHYLFIRAVSSESGDTFYRVLPKWYTTLKSFAAYTGLSDYLRTSNQPVAATDADVLRWGETGVEDGLRDYKTRTGDEPSLKTNGLDTAFSFLKDRFY